jgi:hypothetical protein
MSIDFSTRPDSGVVRPRTDLLSPPVTAPGKSCSAFESMDREIRSLSDLRRSFTDWCRPSPPTLGGVSSEFGRAELELLGVITPPRANPLFVSSVICYGSEQVPFLRPARPSLARILQPNRTWLPAATAPAQAMVRNQYEFASHMSGRRKQRLRNPRSLDGIYLSKALRLLSLPWVGVVRPNPGEPLSPIHRPLWAP